MKSSLDTFLRAAEKIHGGRSLSVVRAEETASGAEEEVAYDVERINDGSGHVVVAEAESEAWEFSGDAHQATLWIRVDSNVSPVIARQAEMVMAEMLEAVEPHLGTASRELLAGRLLASMRWAIGKFDSNKGSFREYGRAVARIVWRRLVSQLTDRGLRAEKHDERRRWAAARDPIALATYLHFVQNEMTRWLAWRTRRSLAQAREDDRIHNVVARVLELLRSGELHKYVRPGAAAWWAVRDEVLCHLRRLTRMWLVEDPADLLHAAPARADEQIERREQEEAWERHPIDQLRQRLSKTQRKYLDAMIIELQLGSMRGAASRVATRLARDKAQVTRAFEHIRNEARVLGLEELRLG